MTFESLAGRYRIERELGRGGMATVYLATDLRLSRPVAVKVMHPGGDGRRAERFRREAELVASLKHPNVLEIHDFGEDPASGPFLVCEWVRGENLRELATRLGPVPPEVAALLGWELSRALGAAHARGIVHRDVKPENVLVAAGGPLKLADFGIAALRDQERLTSTGAITGSLPYMAPERIDTGAYSPASDVYAVGVILFELCAGAPPHAGKGAAHLAASVMTRDAPSLAEVVPGTPEPLVALVARCLARDARDRPVDGVALDAALAEVLQALVGAPAEESRAFFREPRGYTERWREARFARLLAEGRELLTRGEGARAARMLNAALELRPDSPEVVALLRERPGARRSKTLLIRIGAALVGVASVAGVVTWTVGSGRSGGTEVRNEVAAPPPPVEVRVEAPAPVEAPAVVRAPRGEEQAPPAPTKERTPPIATAKRPRPEPSRARESTPPPLVPSVRPSSTLEAPPQASVEAPGTLRVRTSPWAEVFVDGRSRGYTPRVRDLNLSPGTHRLRFVNPLCTVVEKELHVVSGETVSWDVVLEVHKAELQVTAPAGAWIFVDGREVGMAPLSSPVLVEHGHHVVTARVNGRAPLRREVDVTAGGRTELVLEVAP
jgi:serine/threonine-protein kinase